MGGGNPAAGARRHAALHTPLAASTRGRGRWIRKTGCPRPAQGSPLLGPLSATAQTRRQPSTAAGPPTWPPPQVRQPSSGCRCGADPHMRKAAAPKNKKRNGGSVEPRGWTPPPGPPPLRGGWLVRPPGGPPHLDRPRSTPPRWPRGYPTTRRNMYHCHPRGGRIAPLRWHPAAPRSAAPRRLRATDAQRSAAWAHARPMPCHGGGGWVTPTNHGGEPEDEERWTSGGGGVGKGGRRRKRGRRPRSEATSTAFT